MLSSLVNLAPKVHAMQDYSKIDRLHQQTAAQMHQAHPSPQALQIKHSVRCAHWYHDKAEEAKNTLVFTVIASGICDKARWFWKFWGYGNCIVRLRFAVTVLANYSNSIASVRYHYISQCSYSTISSCIVVYHYVLCIPLAHNSHPSKPRLSFACSKSWLATALSRVKTQTCAGQWRKKSSKWNKHHRTDWRSSAACREFVYEFWNLQGSTWNVQVSDQKICWMQWMLFITCEKAIGSNSRQLHPKDSKCAFSSFRWSYAQSDSVQVEQRTMTWVEEAHLAPKAVVSIPTSKDWHEARRPRMEEQFKEFSRFHSIAVPFAPDSIP